MLTADMQRIIEEQRLGFVATAAPDGTPNVSPKGTFIVLDDETIAFGEIRSPGTLRNLRANPPCVTPIQADASPPQPSATRTPYSCLDTSW
jgi:predicted pyridoxine 5'-phosphate oxidase superfamily flavin-nucleotide-binding protein